MKCLPNCQCFMGSYQLLCTQKKAMSCILASTEADRCPALQLIARAGR